MRANEEALRATIWNLRRATNIHGDIFVSNAYEYQYHLSHPRSQGYPCGAQFQKQRQGVFMISLSLLILIRQPVNSKIKHLTAAVTIMRLKSANILSSSQSSD